MNRPSELIKELEEFDESFYGYELARSECKEIVNYIQKLEKALDKACEYINDIHSCPYDTFDFEVKGGCESVCLERTENSSLCWKEWLLKDD